MTDSQKIERPEAGWLPMVFIGLGVALIIMDATIVNVILPHIITDLQINSIDAEWVNAIYALTFASFLIVMGRLGDRYGSRKIFISGALLFAISSIMAANAPSGTLLICARALQGIGGAMMSPTSLSLVNSLYRGKSRAIAFALYGSIIGGMAAIGPLMGGWLTQTFSWHWSFWINVPIAMLIAFGAWKFVPESKAVKDGGAPDYLGAVASTLGTAALIFGLIEGRNYGWWKVLKPKSFLGITWDNFSPVPVALMISVISFLVLYVVCKTRSRANKSVLIDFALFKIKTFGLGSFAGLIVSLGEFGILFSLPLFLQNVLGWSTLGAGGLLATLALGAFIAAPSAALIANSRNPRFVARLGLLLEIVGIAGIGVVASPSVSGWNIGLWLLVYGLGVGYATAQLTGLILADIPMEKSGQASGTQSTARQIGAAMGTAVLGTILFVSLEKNTYTKLTEIGVPDETARALAHSVESSAGTVIPRLAQSSTEAIHQATQTAFAQAIHYTAFAAGFFVLLGLLATLALPPGKSSEPHDDNDQSKLIQSFEE